MLFYFLLKLDILSMETYGPETICGRIKKTGKTFYLSKSELKVIFFFPWPKSHSCAGEKHFPHNGLTVSVRRKKQLFFDPLEILFLQHNEYNYNHELKSKEYISERKILKLAKIARKLIAVCGCVSVWIIEPLDEGERA